MRNHGWNFILFILLTLLAACAPQPTKEVPQEFKKGQDYFHRVCSNCHGSDAMGGHTKAPKLIDNEFIESEYPNDEIRETILNGINKMPPQKNNVSADEITEIIKYLRYSQKAANLFVEEDPSAEDEFSDEEGDEELDEDKEGA